MYICPSPGSNVSKQTSHPASKTQIIPPTLPPKRGAFIVLEGVDRCGKTTQCGMLVKRLLSMSIAAAAFRFPDRTTSIGELIDGYLRSGKEVDDRSVHLLFSANRWECSTDLVKMLADGKTVICDRYAYSGVAFSSAKRKEDRKGGCGSDLSIDWCKAPDVGLPAPDSVIFLDLEQDEAERRGGYGGERYEKRDLQIRVRQRFEELQEMDEQEKRTPWHVIDASRSIEEVQDEIFQIVDRVLRAVYDGAALKKLWMDGDFELPSSVHYLN